MDNRDYKTMNFNTQDEYFKKNKIDEMISKYEPELRHVIQFSRPNECEILAVQILRTVIRDCFGDIKNK